MPRASSHRHHPRDRAQPVTTARRSQDEDRSRRMKHYLWAMGVRTACFPLAVWAFATGRYGLAWVAAIGAAVIPSFAVMLANAVDHKQTPAKDGLASPVPGLGPGRQETPAPQGSPATDGGGSPAQHDPPDTPILGTIVSSRDTPYPAAEGDPSDRDTS